ncbi:MAG TPA: alcohol dehydrogenase, partial [Thermoprotei archaeon]|nr:alcohol dehydrogenase [Thermoprotei archaeon]
YNILDIDLNYYTFISNLKIGDVISYNFMKAIVLEEIGKTPVLKDIEVPSVKDDWILVKVMRTAVCYRDILTIDGFFPRAKTPLVLGHEFAGIVEEVGENIVEFKKGDEIVSLSYIPCGDCEYCRNRMENLCINRKWYGEELDGSFSEYILVHKNSLIKMEPKVDWNYASISSCVIGMLIHALKDLGGIKEGMKVLVTGASGGVGVHAIQVARALGGEVIAYTSKEEKAKFIEDNAKPDHIIIGEKEFSKIVKREYGGVDLVLELVGEPTFIQSLRSAKWGGKVLVIGNVNVKNAQLPLGLIILRENMITGVLSSTKENVKLALELGSKKLVKAVGNEISLTTGIEAFNVLRSGGSRGKFFLKP